jgi:predicted transcriptional regulator
VARTTTIGVRLTPAEVARLDNLAAATKQDRSKVLRLLLSAAVAGSAPTVKLEPEALGKGGRQ